MLKANTSTNKGQPLTHQTTGQIKVDLSVQKPSLQHLKETPWKILNT